MLQQIATRARFRPPSPVVMNYFSTPALLTSSYDITHKIEGVVDRPLVIGDVLREHWRLPSRQWDMPPRTYSEADGHIFVGTEWTCVERIENSAYLIEGRYLTDGTGPAFGEPYTAVSYFFFPTATDGTDLLRVWVTDTATDDALTSSYVQALEQIRERVDALNLK